MREKECAHVIYEQLVEFGGNRHALATESGNHLGEDAVETRRPRSTTDSHLVRRQLPHLAYRLVENRLLATTIRRARRLLDERGNLGWRNRKGQHPHAFDLQFRHGNLHHPIDEKVSGPLHAFEQLLQRFQSLVVFDAYGFIGHARQVIGFDTKRQAACAPAHSDGAPLRAKPSRTSLAARFRKGFRTPLNSPLNQRGPGAAPSRLISIEYMGNGARVVILYPRRASDRLSPRHFAAQPRQFAAQQYAKRDHAAGKNMIRMFMSA